MDIYFCIDWMVAKRLVGISSIGECASVHPFISHIICNLSFMEILLTKVNFSFYILSVAMDEKEIIPDTKPDNFELLKTPRFKWNELGNQISTNEHSPVMVVPADKYITLRLDGRSFSTKFKTLRNAGSLPQYGYSMEFHNLMVMAMHKLCEKWNVFMAYTQSDEMTLLIAPHQNTNYEHPFGGKRDKLISLSAAQLSVFMTVNIHRTLPDVPANFEVEFDCRLASFDMLQEAVRVIQWRSYDGLGNGISDAVFHSGHKNRRQATGLDSRKKIAWLKERDLWLHVPVEQLFGTVLKRQLVVKEAVNQLTNEPTQCERHIYVPQPRVEFCMDNYVITTVPDMYANKQSSS